MSRVGDIARADVVEGWQRNICRMPAQHQQWHYQAELSTHTVIDINLWMGCEKQGASQCVDACRCDAACYVGHAQAELAHNPLLCLGLWLRGVKCSEARCLHPEPPLTKLNTPMYQQAHMTTIPCWLVAHLLRRANLVLRPFIAGRV